MIKFKAQFTRSVINLPGKLSIHKGNVSQYEDLMKKDYAHMIEEVTSSEEKALPEKSGKGKLSSTPAESKE